ncbi:uncharacterized protein LOC129739475 [Uranotaenia lowii]|uniref:uncharacterized protein LOC129739475 n=1 Tax=Uranotaenia lowii TaxID=190385 RepID=UPI0024790FB0|nr:uncharacterized protein LOC129739475 [Uranotaenia lowii]
MTNKKKNILKDLRGNSNFALIEPLKSITPNTTAKDLTEAQKIAFTAMMRMALDPQDRNWNKRREKLDRKARKRMEAEQLQQREQSTITFPTIEQFEVKACTQKTPERRHPYALNPHHHRGASTTKPSIQRKEIEQQQRKPEVYCHRPGKLKREVQQMRIKRTFPLPPTRPGDACRRFGFIPASERKPQLNDYRK